MKACRLLSTLLSLLTSVPFFLAAPAPVLDEYEFVRNLDRYVGFKHGDSYSVGKLDEAGNFLPDPRWCNVKGALSDAPPFTLLNDRPGRVYEYRSGRLIIGDIDEKGLFLPDLGSRIMSLKDYRPGGTTPRIYNLPGSFVKKGEKEKEN